MPNVLVDSGPLAALFNRRDHHHQRSLDYFRRNGDELKCHTTWEVVSEVMYLLDFSAEAQASFLDWIFDGSEQGLMKVASLAPEDLPGLAQLIRKYSDRPMDMADASLVWLANKTGITDIITVDRADFSVYRTNRRKAFRNVF
ncbi:MAG: hypothetical protein A3H35_15735 [Betaproteobacteria bacterium RIFCSPLOWO2_02_FULL_62_17]|nr:MAG: hypothetical protein A3H35_15735 [Betaproteobacteria bacterium RIFCSPLOWO2_02_FULL_62_17]